MRALVAACLVFATAACGPATSTSAPLAVSLPPAKPHPRSGCSDALPPVVKAPPSSVFREAHDRLAAGSSWGKGWDAIALPEGFDDRRQMLTADLADDDEDEARWHGYFIGDGAPKPSRLWIFPGRGGAEPPWNAAAWVVTYPMPSERPPSLFMHAVRVIEADAGGADLPPETTPDQVFNWFNVHGELADGPRRIVEWAYVEKGCERSERYERVVDDGDTLVHIVLAIEGGADDATLADWTARFLDAPLGLPFFEGRRSLAGEDTNR